MEKILNNLTHHFNNLENRYKCFAKYGVQVEGWFKGELHFILENLVDNNFIFKFNREIKVGNSRKKIDLSISLSKENNQQYIEVKHWLIGEQKNIKYHPSFYFSDKRGLINDIKKLLTIASEDNSWILIFMTKNPGEDMFEKGLMKFNLKFYPYNLESLTEPKSFPDSYFISLLQVRNKF